MNKRELLRTSASAGLGLLFGEGLWAHFASLPADRLAEREDFWGAVSASYRLKPDYINLENGYYCIQSLVLVQIPDSRRHLVRYYGAYSNRARGQRRKAESRLEGNGSGETEDPIPPPPERAALRRRWANLIRRVYEVDPLG